ncbi:MAG: DNA repair protein RadA [Candidatus Limivicinus sp.]|nr:DNA repair protein RadA [Clostridiales bacterium]MDY6134025.1 DNA repair protein RadA [Candidatus Limivicinus sp.]
MPPKQKTIYCCSECGNETANWAGKCPSCGAWNTLTELKIDSRAGRCNAYAKTRSMSKPKKISELDMSAEIRFSTGIAELDRVLGGGAVVGSLVLVGGAPGIGKSTLLLQMCGCVDSGRKILYVTGEESERQLKLRAVRLGVDNAEIYVLAETDINSIASCIDELEPEIVIIDSIQTVSDANVDSAPGSISQVRECTMRIMRLTKEKGLTVFVVGHINKEGSIAGPKVLEHMVDCVLYFEGERSTSFRLLRAVKNRFGSTNEIGVFEMDEDGLNGVENPSEALLAGRPENAPGTCVACVVEGTRPILAEVQALVSPSGYNASRRSNGIDYNRAAMLLAVLEKRGGLQVSGCDTYINVIGGLSLDEPAADLATVLAIASSFLDRPLGADLAAIGEVGLSGEIRSVSVINQRLSEISRLGFRRCVIPAHVKDELKQIEGLKFIPVRNIAEALAAVLRRNG